MRFALFGNGRAACLCLDSLLRIAEDEQLLTVAPAGGPHHLWHQSFEDHSRERGIRTAAPDDVNAQSFIEGVAAFGPDVILSVGYTQILGEILLSIPDHAINFHPSLLPDYRGVAPLVWAIVKGEKTTGVTAHEMTALVDNGVIYGQLRIEVNAADTGYSLHQKAAEATERLFGRVLEKLLDNRLEGRAMPTGGSLFTTRTPRVNELAPDSQSRREVEDIVRALAPPLPGAFLMVGDRRLHVDAVDRDVPMTVRRDLERVSAYGTVTIGTRWFLRVRDGWLRLIDPRIVSPGPGDTTKREKHG